MPCPQKDLGSCHHSCMRLCPPFCCARQGASVFNQPLSFDTSSVTAMKYMFHVRSGRALLAPKSSWVLACTLHMRLSPARCVCRHTLPSPDPHHARLVCLPSTRQEASAFDQPLSLDTSSVTTMREMFSVRSTRDLPTLGSLFHAACATLSPDALESPARISPLFPHAMTLFLLGRAQWPSTNR